MVLNRMQPETLCANVQASPAFCTICSISAASNVVCETHKFSPAGFLETPPCFMMAFGILPLPFPLGTIFLDLVCFNRANLIVFLFFLLFLWLLLRLQWQQAKRNFITLKCLLKCFVYLQCSVCLPAWLDCCPPAAFAKQPCRRLRTGLRCNDYIELVVHDAYG